jgi:hypothetical protein
LGVNPNSLKDLGSQLDTVFAKAELEHMKNEVVNTIETHKKRYGFYACQTVLLQEYFHASEVLEMKFE